MTDRGWSHHWIGVDLGKAQDPTALVLDRVSFDGERVSHDVVAAGRAPLGTDYTLLVDRIVAYTAARVDEHGMRGVSLAVDATGPGLPVLDQLRGSLSSAGLGVRLVGIVFTAGFHVNWKPEVVGVPKADLVNSAVAASESGRLRIAAGIAEADVMLDELRAVDREVTAAGRETFVHRSSNQGHADMVMALCCATWAGEAIRPAARAVAGRRR